MGVAQPCGQNIFGGGVLAGQVDIDGSVVADDRHRCGVLADPAGHNVDRHSGALAGTGLEERAKFGCVRRDHEVRDVEAFPLGFGDFTAVEGEEPGPDGLEFQGVEQLLEGCLVRPRVRELVQRHWQIQVGVQPVEAPVALDVVNVFAQGVPHLPADRVEVLQDPLQSAVKVDPFRCRLGADAGNTGEVVRGFPHQGGEVRVLGRADEVLLLDGVRVHAGNIADTLLGVQDENVVGDELEGIAVA
ncbi:hypothetical protein SRABI128_05865 [Microbacterium sp. Bi128]|nr:hypothetical protein SRABI128_05865 [Microbacterium sp. Bi128]